MSVEDNLAYIEGWIDHYEDKLPTGTFFDEVAILVPTLYHRTKLINELCRVETGGWQVFNEARDIVVTSPFSTRYFVKYLFLKHPEMPYRLEIMMMDHGVADTRTGFSPLHASLWPDGKAPETAGLTRFPIPHLSFKPVQRGYETGQQSLQGAYVEALDWLRGKAFIHAQTCHSSYGAFSYWIHQDEHRQIYVKPRINTRDVDVVHDKCTFEGCLP
jgi:hypothetical protein